MVTTFFQKCGTLCFRSPLILGACMSRRIISVILVLVCTSHSLRKLKISTLTISCIENSCIIKVWKFNFSFFPKYTWIDYRTTLELLIGSNCFSQHKVATGLRGVCPIVRQVKPQHYALTVVFVAHYTIWSLLPNIFTVFTARPSRSPWGSTFHITYHVLALCLLVFWPNILRSSFSCEGYLWATLCSLFVCYFFKIILWRVVQVFFLQPITQGTLNNLCITIIFSFL